MGPFGSFVCGIHEAFDWEGVGVAVWLQFSLVIACFFFGLPAGALATLSVSSSELLSEVSDLWEFCTARTNFRVLVSSLKFGLFLVSSNIMTSCTAWSMSAGSLMYST